MKRKALGKGLRSLIRKRPAARRLIRRTAPPGRLRSRVPPSSALAYPQVDIDRIVPNHRQPRERFDQEALQALANSLKNQGVLQPVLLRPFRTAVRLVAGERRWRAAQLAGLLKIRRSFATSRGPDP